MSLNTGLTFSYTGFKMSFIGPLHRIYCIAYVLHMCLPLYSGLYDFEVTNPDTLAKLTVRARFTFVWTTPTAKDTDSDADPSVNNASTKNIWKIRTHHSSLLPNPITITNPVSSEPKQKTLLRGVDSTHTLNSNLHWLDQDHVTFH